MQEWTGPSIDEQVEIIRSFREEQRTEQKLTEEGIKMAFADKADREPDELLETWFSKWQELTKDKPATVKEMAAATGHDLTTLRLMLRMITVNEYTWMGYKVSREANRECHCFLYRVAQE